MPWQHGGRRTHSAIVGRLRRFFALDLLDNRYPELHGLRVLAILSVVQFHVTSIFALEQSIGLGRDWVMSSLAIFFGMDLFFVLSGFLIGSILLYSLKHQQKNPIRRFYLRRVFRTFPAYYVVLTVLALTYHLTAEQRHHLWMEYAYLTNFSELGRKDVVMVWGWSLALEEQFYLIVPLLFWGLARLRSDGARLAALGALWASALVVRAAIYFSRPEWTDLDIHDALYKNLYTRYDTLVAGMFLAVAHDRYGERIARWLDDPFRRALVGMAALLGLWMLARPWLFAQRSLNLFHVFAWGSITTVMYTCMLVLLLYGRGIVHTFLGAPLFRSVATLGYGVYLVHIPICDHVIVPTAHRLVARNVPLELVWPISFTLLFALSLLVAYVMHLLIEKPSLWARDRVA